MFTLTDGLIEQNAIFAHFFIIYITFLYKFLIFNRHGKIGKSRVLNAHTYTEFQSSHSKPFLLLYMYAKWQWLPKAICHYTAREAPMLQSILQPQQKIPGGSNT